MMKKFYILACILYWISFLLGAEFPKPTIDLNEDYCVLEVNSSMVMGKCTTIYSCPSALQLWEQQGILPKTCSHDNLDHIIVCCPDNHTANANIKTAETTSTTMNSVSEESTIITTTTTTSQPPTVLEEKCNTTIANSTIPGVCKNIRHCPSAHRIWKTMGIQPDTCYSQSSTYHSICCLQYDSNQMFNAKLRSVEPSSVRISEMKCMDLFYKTYTGYAIGIATKPKEFPFMCALGWKSELDDTKSFKCGCVLISKKFVLTAAHCASLRGLLPTVVRVGGENLTDSSVDEINILRIIEHPDYDPTSSYNDIAVIELEKEASQDPACVWSDDDLEQKNLTALGYGDTKYAGSASDQLIKAALFFVDNNECGSYYDADTTKLERGLVNSQLCANNPKERMDTCQGDSGGPILMAVKREKMYTYVVGITSFGQVCGYEAPGVYTRTSSYIDWIEQIVWKEEFEN